MSSTPVIELFDGDCRQTMKQIFDSTIDCVVTDPPSGISFMGKAWDSFQAEGLTELQAFQGFIAEAFTEVHRVLKPGAHGFVWALPRTSHHTAMGLERAGFEVRDVVTHLFGTGMPKGLDIGKKLPEWDGWHTTLKPLSEHWLLIRKPLDGTIIENVQKHHTGGLNIGASRLGTDNDGSGDRSGEASAQRRYDGIGVNQTPGPRGGSAEGRHPSNVIVSHNEDCVLVGTTSVKSGTATGHNRDGEAVANKVYGARRKDTNDSTYAGADGLETVEAYDCTEGCAVAHLDAQAGVRTSGAYPTRRNSDKCRNTFGTFKGRTESESKRGANSGTASRFFYTVKPSTKSKNNGLPTGMKNDHPTVKSVELMRYLIGLVCPPGGTVLDPFMGSGSTLVAAVGMGFNVMGCEADEHFAAIAAQRIRYALEMRTWAEGLKTSERAPALG